MKQPGRTTATADGLEREPRLWWLIVVRGPELELRCRSRSGPGSWRMRCPADDSHEVTLAYNGTGIALSCHGPAGSDSPGHSLTTHRKQRVEILDNLDAWDRHHDLHEIPFPCRWCGCAESQVLAALGARPRDKFQQVEAQRDGRCRCGASGYGVGKLPVLCLAHLAERVGLDRSVLFGAQP